MAPKLSPSQLRTLRRQLAERDGSACHYCGAPLSEAFVRSPPLAAPGGHCGCGEGIPNPDGGNPDSPLCESMQLCVGCVNCEWGWTWPPGTQQVYIDHIWPKSRGGGNSLNNLVLACLACNSAKGSTPYPEFLERIGGRRCPG